MTYHFTAIATLVALILYLWMATRVARARVKAGILPPVMSGDPVLERTLRAHLNTLEWLPAFLGGLWLFAVYWGDVPAALLGALWIVGRLVYFLGYRAEARRRLPGFFIQALTTAVLLLGALGKVIYVLATGG